MLKCSKLSKSFRVFIKCLRVPLERWTEEPISEPFLKQYKDKIITFNRIQWSREVLARFICILWWFWTVPIQFPLGWERSAGLCERCWNPGAVRNIQSVITCNYLKPKCEQTSNEFLASFCVLLYGACYNMFCWSERRLNAYKNELYIPAAEWQVWGFFHKRPDLRETCDFNRSCSKCPGARRIAERRKWMKLYPYDSARQLRGDRFPHALRQGTKLKPACPETFPLHSLHVSVPHPEHMRF